MKKPLNLESRIKAMKLGTSFIVDTAEQRQDCLKAAKTLFRAGIIEFKIVTRKTDDEKFQIIAA